MSWYRLGLVGNIEKVNQAAWYSAWQVSKAKSRVDYGRAIFYKVAGRNGLTLYFTPSAQALAETFGSKPCRKPSPKGLSLFVGDHRAWRIHFPIMFWKRSTRNGLNDAHPPKPVDSVWPSQFR